VGCTEGAVRLTIADNGKGFIWEQALHDRLGLGIMSERARAIGASLEITSQPGEGATISVFWPFDDLNHEPHREEP